MLLCSKQMAKDVADTLALVLARSGNPWHDVGPCCSTAYYIYKTTSRQNNIELGTRRNEVSLIILITDKRGKPIPCQSSRHTSAVWENLFRQCRTQMCHTSCLATLPLDFYVAAAYKNQQSMSINAMNEKKTSGPYGINISGTKMAEFPKQRLDKGRCPRNSSQMISNLFLQKHAAVVRMMIHHERKVWSLVHTYTVAFTESYLTSNLLNRTAPPRTLHQTRDPLINPVLAVDTLAIKRSARVIQRDVQDVYLSWWICVSLRHMARSQAPNEMYLYIRLSWLSKKSQQL